MDESEVIYNDDRLVDLAFKSKETSSSPKIHTFHKQFEMSV